MTDNAIPGPLDPEELQIQYAKSFLLQTDNSGLSLYEHLSALLSRILSERPPNALEVFESLSAELHWSRLKQGSDVLRAPREESHTCRKAEVQRALFSRGDGEGEESEAEGEMTESPLPNLLDLAHLLQQGGVNLGRDEAVRISLALKRLTDTHPLQVCHFWGKILGSGGSYLVAEVQFREGEDDEAEEGGEEEEKGEVEDDFGEEEGEEEEEGAVRDTYEENPDFEGIPVSELVESLSNWVHHVQHILPQGRCVWVNTSVKSEEEEDEEEAEEEEKEEENEPEPEVGPPLLTPLSEDAEIGQTPPWTAFLSTHLIPHYALAVLRSNLWPGAYTVSSAKKFENIYIGWGLKYMPEGYSPPAPPAPQAEYPSGPEITESTDPTVEEEQALKAAKEEAEAAAEEMEEEEDEEEEEDD
ncbi:hypothetical protein XENTR_v10021163 [Xenopus tropicalis]|nr:hypothetical protein XENTR_v10021163 [Xenopus tropicalis]